MLTMARGAEQSASDYANPESISHRACHGLPQPHPPLPALPFFPQLSECRAHGPHRRLGFTRWQYLGEGGW
jgi:hypothetical protein